MAKSGRPSTYTQDIANNLTDYVNETIGKKRIPFIQEFCYKNKIHRKTFYRWLSAKDEDGTGLLYPELDDAYDELMAMQEMMLIELGIAGKASAATCIFLLKTKHGHVETEKVQHVGNTEEPITIIFTDSDTYKKHRESVKRLEAKNKKITLNNQVYNGERSEQVGHYDWSDYINHR